MTIKSVLIIEDDDWLAEQYSRILSKQKYIIKISSNALDAIIAIDDFHPDAIIVDLLLTGSTALTLLHELQSYEDIGMIPVIMCTNLANEISIDNLKPYGVRRIIDKATMMPDDLLIALRSLEA